MNPALATYPTRKPLTGVEVTLALLRHSQSRATRLWYAEGVCRSDALSADNTWVPLKDFSMRAGKWCVWFWRRALTIPDCESLLGAIRSGQLSTDHHVLELNVQERPPVFLSCSTDRPFCPREGMSSWLLEFWDERKDVTELVDEKWKRKINAAVKRALGIDLDHWNDRIGNILMFIPAGVRVAWNYDPVSEAAIIQTDLDAAELDAYELEVIAWDGEDLSYQRRCRLARPATVFEGLRQFQRIQWRMWKHGCLICQDGPDHIVKGIDVAMHVAVGTRAGNTYTRSATSTTTALDRSPWTRLQRDRRVATSKARLVESLEFKFYEPLATSSQITREQAVTDVHAILSHARTSIRIWDPYFGAQLGSTDRERVSPQPDDVGIDDLQFVESITELSLSIQILTSAEDFTITNGSATLNRLGARIGQLQRDFPERFKTVRCKAWVRAKETAFHDRFLILDDRSVWLMGSSLGGLGKKHSVLVKLEHADEVIAAFDQVWNGRIGAWGHVIDVAGK